MKVIFSYSRPLLIGLMLSAALVSVFAGGRPEEQPHPQLQIVRPWMRPVTSAGGNSGAYLGIGNPNAQADRLLAARAEGVRMVELHTHIQDGEMMRMRRVDDIPIPANGIVELAPGGLHVMLIGVQSTLALGDELEITLVFERAGELVITVPVLNQAPGN